MTRRDEAIDSIHWEACPAVERTPGKVSGAWVFAGTRIPLHALYETSPAVPPSTNSSSGFPVSIGNKCARCWNMRRVP